MRRTVYGLRPPALDELGLAGSLREQVECLRCQAPALVVNLQVPEAGLADLPAAVEVACYRIVSEALANVVRHAQAGVCVVRLWRDASMRVLVLDDGVGLAQVLCVATGLLPGACADHHGPAPILARDRARAVNPAAGRTAAWPHHARPGSPPMTI